ncbi:dehydrogenase/reductase SDR family member 13-like isoform X1 [Scleropages formosus]|uniref:Dehydrogenase/reductase 13 n=1 Tax=Scleropages formosus TaxID=113540 RepID=A0A8C9RPZ2_SCLFO|nr:dehydrogenase/reductase SDR family member 13-like isoform X1 [Scleropages formosus]
MDVLLLALAVIVPLYGVMYLVCRRGAQCESKSTLYGKTVIVTGGNAGIGKATALDLARRGARVILACRNKQRAEAAVCDIIKESGNNQVVYMQLDLASLQSVRSFAETFLKQESRLDILINNAALMLQGRTEDGLGMIFGVNHIGHFLLTHLLLERLKECAPSRVINVSSMAYKWGHIDFNSVETHKTLRTSNSFMQLFKAYCDTKLCNILFTCELAKMLQGTGVTCYSVHPGAVHTEFTRNFPTIAKILTRPMTFLFFKDPMAGAQTTLHCALQEGIEPLSGRYFENCAVMDVNAEARDDATAKKLWEISERFCGLS